MREKEEHQKVQTKNENCDQAEKEEPKQQQLQPTVHPPQLEPFQDTVVLKKPFGLRINKTTLQVTYVEGSGPSAGSVFVGDVIVTANGQKINTIGELNNELKKPSTAMAVGFNRAYYSKCKHKGTFVEKISVERDREMRCTGRAIDLYSVQMAIQISDLIDMNEILGLSVKYDAKERIQVAATSANSLSSIHLRPGDIIREVNECPIASKTMLDHFIQAGITQNGQASFIIECGAGDIDAYRDQVDLANDVLEIAQNQVNLNDFCTDSLDNLDCHRYESCSMVYQIAQFRTAVVGKALNKPSILRKQQTSKSSKKITISNSAVELTIGADYAPSQLKKCKGSNVEARTMEKNLTS